MPDPRRGTIAWADLNPVRGREQSGRRPVLVVSSDDYNDSIPNVVVVLPLTTRDRGLPHHVPIPGLPRASYAMTEQVRTIDRQRIGGVIAEAGQPAMREVDGWLRDFLNLP